METGFLSLSPQATTTGQGRAREGTRMQHAGLPSFSNYMHRDFVLLTHVILDRCCDPFAYHLLHSIYPFAWLALIILRAEAGGLRRSFHARLAGTFERKVNHGEWPWNPFFLPHGKEFHACVQRVESFVLGAWSLKLGASISKHSWYRLMTKSSTTEACSTIHTCVLEPNTL